MEQRIAHHYRHENETPCICMPQNNDIEIKKKIVIRTVIAG